MLKFKVGDRVRAIKDHDGNDHIVNQEGTVIISGTHDVGVEFDKAVDGHTCGGRGKDFHCWWCTDDVLEPVAANEKIVITTDGKTTTAALYNGKQRIKDAKATCASGDRFDFEIGAKIAFDRLMGYVPCMLDTTFDWNEFKAGKIAVKVTKDNFKDFVAEAKKHKLTFEPDENFNPFHEMVDTLFRAIMQHVDVKENEIYIACEDDALKIAHCLMDLEEFVW